MAPGIDPVVDIVAIHGLQGHRDKTWTSDNGVCWLRDLLPSDFPNARILSYGYDADVHSRECVSTQTIGRHAQGLIDALSRKREDSPRALVISHNQSLESKSRLRDVLVSTCAVLFFGTPHFGVEGTTFAEINPRSSLHMKTTDSILKDLQFHSTELENIQNDWLVASERIKSIFFSEDYPVSDERNEGVFNVPHPLAVIPGDRNATTIILHANHRNLVRFSSRENDNYQTVHFYLKGCVSNGPERIRKNWVREDNCRNAAQGGPTLEIPNNFDKTTILQLPSVAFAPSSVHKACLPGTRRAVLETISHWAENDTPNKPIFWLCDIAGAGKSTVAMSAMESWQKQGVLGGRFFFSMSSNDASTTEKLCSTIARDLVQYIPELAPHVSRAVTQNPSIMRGSLDEQFQTLVTGPLQHRQGRVILVIDAVDECTSASQRKQLLETLSTAVQGCKNLRIFMTSRPDPVIETVLGSLSIKSKLEDRLHSVRHRDNIDDVAIYVGQTLDGVLSKDKIQRLVEKANGLFIWASTACRMLTDEATLNSPDSLYDRLISLDQRGAIDKVYDLIFERIDEESHPVLCQMLALLLVAFEPLTFDDMEHLVKHTRVPGTVKGLLKNLGSVLSTEPGTNLIHFRHLTLVEYLQRCSNFPAGGSHKRISLDVINAHGQAASWCLQHLKSRTDGLKFNICQLESSFYLNKQIPDLDIRISKFIPRRLQYASSHWLFHVLGMDDKKPCPLEDDVGYILRSPQVLYWMEVLSFTRSVPRAIDGLRALSDNMALGEEIRWRINDTLRCLIAFLVPIQDSAPHIYISALPFMPKKSILRIEGLGKNSETLRVTQGLEEAYPGFPDSLRGHSDSVWAVAFSPDGSRIVSGSSDQTIRLWDAKTGEPVGEPLRGHSNSVLAVAFSPDGSRIVSGSHDDTIRLWDAKTGEPVGEPLRGHSNSVW
ncbi:hypothetical protein PIIN_02913, partial [Serendipita indica DSM 11827]